jgi:outer membrane lipoprotein-sorting protein
MINRISMAVLLLFAAGSACAAEPTGREIALKMRAVDTSRDMQAEAVMVVERQGMKLNRKMEIRAKKFGPDERRLIRFSEPSDVSGTMYLTWSYADPDREDDMWIYLPAESLVRRISGGGKKGSFMRSDLSNEDIETREVDDDTHTLLGDESVSGIDCWIVESIPLKQRDSNYAKRILWIGKETFLPVKIDFFNSRDELLKTGWFGGFKQIKGIWTYTKMMFETPSKGSRTLMQYTQYDYNLGLPDPLFEMSVLKR